MTIDVKRLAVDAGYWDECGAPEYAEQFDVEAELFCCPKGYWVQSNFQPYLKECQPDEPGRFIPRPQSEWVDGLPPTGVECEYKNLNVNYRFDFVKVKPLFFSDQVCVLELWSSGNHFMERIEDCEFRPIPTKAQRDRDELAEVISSELGEGKYLGQGLADKIIAAGWTKP